MTAGVLCNLDTFFRIVGFVFLEWREEKNPDSNAAGSLFVFHSDGLIGSMGV